MISPYCIFEVNKLAHDGIFLILNINHISILYTLLLQKHVQSHTPNNFKVMNKNKISCNLWKAVLIENYVVKTW
jgi:hypothetical protein